MTSHRLKKALFKSAFFIACLNIIFPATGYGASTYCHDFKATESAEVRYIHDGDTLFLSDNRKVRLIGINTPELARKRGKQPKPEEPYGIAARDFARQLVSRHGNKVKLMPGVEKFDRYGRALFHVQLANGELLQSALLKAGYAFAIAYPPNTRLTDCYLTLEQQAHDQQLNIWSHPAYQPVTPTGLAADRNGFVILRGKVSHIGESRKAFWINLEGNVAARIAKKNWHYFEPLSLQSLVGRQIEVRGWLRHYKKRAQLSLRHPSSLRVITH